MKIIGIEHIGIAVKNIKEASPFWDHVLQISHSTTQDVDEQGVITDIYDTGQGKLELLQAKYPDSPVAKFLDRRGPGIHHICLQVEDIDEAVQDLKSKGISVPVLISKIQEIIILTIDELDITAKREKNDTRVWIGQKKIASIGLSVRNWITYHGFSLNVNTDLEKFNTIRPCGHDSKIMTSVSSIKRKEYSKEVIQTKIIRNFSNVFEYNRIQNLT